MKAVVVTGARQLRVADVEATAPAAGEVAVAVTGCGICGSNLHEWRHPDQRISAEAVPGTNGHEVTGRVGAVGAGVGMAVGTRVVVEPNLAQACGRCDPCHEGTAWFCRDRRSIANWGFAEVMNVPEQAVFVLPDEIDDTVGTLVEPLACTVHALRGTARALAGGDDLGGATVAIVGAGVAGLLALRAAAHLGVARLVSVARHDHQAQAAAALGADLVLDANADDLRDQLRAQRPDVVVEAVGGRADTFDLAVHTVAPAGEVVVLGLFEEPQTLNTRRAVFRELRLSFPVTYGRRSGVHDFTLAIAALQATPTAAHLVSHTYPLDDVDAAFRRADDKSAGVLRVVVTP